MPRASRAQGDKIWRVGVFAGLFAGLWAFDAFDRAFDARDVWPDREDAARRDGEVFVGTYTSMITGRITGLRWVTS
jgi:hypothetical protein